MSKQTSATIAAQLEELLTLGRVGIVKRQRLNGKRLQAIGVPVGLATYEVTVSEHFGPDHAHFDGESLAEALNKAIRASRRTSK